MRRSEQRVCAIVGVLAVALLVGGGVGAQKRPWPNTGEDPTVTPVAGPSWLTRLGLKIGDTNLGQGSRRYGPSADQTRRGTVKPLMVRQKVPITGADLYRLNCQACHREEGTGAPPEIHSVLTPVQGSSLPLVRKRLQAEQSRSVERQAQEEANKARVAVLVRMHEGGRRMPPRDYLRAEDTHMLFGYLTQLAGAPDAPRQATRTISWARLGELTIKGTCHVCHDATGAAPSGAALMKGAIPSLESLMTTKHFAEFIRKVREGDVVSAGDPLLRHRGRMPVFHFLRDEDVAAAYMYLATYPPHAR
jgi:mono/diheme cytochrome c family protein